MHLIEHFVVHNEVNFLSAFLYQPSLSFFRFQIQGTCFPCQSLIISSQLFFTVGEERAESLAGMNKKPLEYKVNCGV